MTFTSNFHKPEDSVFNTGEIWYASDNTDEAGIVIVNKHRYGEGAFDASIYYRGAGEKLTHVFDKDAWNFQVRYTHSSERYKQRNADDN